LDKIDTQKKAYFLGLFWADGHLGEHNNTLNITLKDTDKDILITPNVGSTDDPKIEFKGADASTSAQTITANVYPSNNGTVSFEGSGGQLFSINNSTSGTIFSVNDLSGVPSIEVKDTGLVRLAEYAGDVVIGQAADSGAKRPENRIDPAAHCRGYCGLRQNQVLTLRLF